jgi:hypothetical protein
MAHSVLAGDKVTVKKLLQSNSHVNINLKNMVNYILFHFFVFSFLLCCIILSKYTEKLHIYYDYFYSVFRMIIFTVFLEGQF